MTRVALVLVFALVAILSGCRSVTTAILMPDEDGKVGSVTVRTPTDIRVIEKAFHYVAIMEGSSRLSEIQTMSEAQLNQQYAELLKAQPTKPASFLLYFVAGTTDLTEASLSIIPDVVNKIKERSPTKVTIIGHTDTTGAEEINNSLSSERARAVDMILKEKIPNLVDVGVHSFGSRELLIPTAPNVDEPRNRRVEIFIL